MQQVIFPYPINESKLSQGSIEHIDFGVKTYKVKLPPNLTFGQKIRLKGLAGNVDESFNGQDLLLLLKKDISKFSNLQKDILIELPIDLESLKRSTTKRVNIMDKKFDIKIPVTSSYGQILRMQGLAEICNGGYPGDILLKIAEQPNIKRGILHKIFGNFVGFETPAAERIFKIVFKLPWLFEATQEWHFKNSDSSLHGNY